MLANYFIIRRIRFNRDKMEQIKKLLEQIEYEKKIRKLLLVSLGLSRSIHFLTRGGSTDFINMVNTDYIVCKIDEGVNYLHNSNITVSSFTSIWSNISCFTVYYRRFGFTNLYQTFRKIWVTLLLGGIGPLMVIGGPTSLAFASMLGVSGLKLAFTNLDFIPTSPITVKDLRPRIAGISEVVVVNNRDKVSISDPLQKTPECWLPDQRFLNSNCEIRPTDVPNAIDSVLPDLKYEETVNMQDVTGLDQVEFTDKFDLGQTKRNICKPQKTKEISFLKKFGDSGPIGEDEGWKTC